MIKTNWEYCNYIEAINEVRKEKTMFEEAPVLLNYLTKKEKALMIGFNEICKAMFPGQEINDNIYAAAVSKDEFINNIKDVIADYNAGNADDRRVATYLKDMLINNFGEKKDFLFNIRKILAKF